MLERLRDLNAAYHLYLLDTITQCLRALNKGFMTEDLFRWWASTAAARHSSLTTGVSAFIWAFS